MTPKNRWMGYHLHGRSTFMINMEPKNPTEKAMSAPRKVHLNTVLVLLFIAW